MSGGLSAAQRAEFDRDGYLILRGFADGRPTVDTRGYTINDWMPIEAA